MWNHEGTKTRSGRLDGLPLRISRVRRPRPLLAYEARSSSTSCPQLEPSIPTHPTHPGFAIRAVLSSLRWKMPRRPCGWQPRSSRRFRRSRRGDSLSIRPVIRYTFTHYTDHAEHRNHGGCPSASPRPLSKWPGVSLPEASPGRSAWRGFGVSPKSPRFLCSPI
jgi:hypothetical protein